jgi:hypothetical protein
VVPVMAPSPDAKPAQSSRAATTENLRNIIDLHS